MTKNILKKFYLTDEFEDDDNIILDDITNAEPEDTFTKVELSDYTNDEISNSELISSEFDSEDDSIPKIEFIVEENENKEKQIRMNFEFKVSNSNETVKIDLEISKNMYLEIADELLK